MSVEKKYKWGRDMAKQPADQENEAVVEADEPPVRHCGIVMPIAAMLPDYDAAHWSRVKEIISEAIEQADMVPRLVSESDEVGVIHGQIVQNLYADEIVVVDVSGKNPNVMFELGLRLAFDKPTIIVQDDSNGYSFDIGPIKHIGYRKDQRFDDVQQFKESVQKAIRATLAKKQADEKFSPFLGHFGPLVAKKVEEHEVPQAEFIMKKLSDIEKTMSRLMVTVNRYDQNPTTTWLLDNPDGYAPTPSELAILDEIQKQIRVQFRKGVPVEMLHNKQMKFNVKRLVSSQMLHKGIHDEKFDELFDRVWDIESKNR